MNIECESCPLYRVCQDEINAANTEREEFLGEAVDYAIMELSRNKLEDEARKLEDTLHANDPTNPLIPKIEQHRLERDREWEEALGKVSSFRSKIGQGIDARLDKYNSLQHEAQNSCRGPLTRRRFWLFGRKILKCTSPLGRTQDRSKQAKYRLPYSP